MEKFVEFIINLLDPPSLTELRMERRWKSKLVKIQNKMKNE